MRKNSFFGSVTQLVSGSALATLIATLSLPVLTRLFDPNDFGIYAIFTSVASIIGVLACLRYEPTIVIPESEQVARTQLSLSVLCAAIVGSVVLILVVIAPPHVLAVAANTIPEPILYLLPLYVFLHGLHLAYSAWCNRLKAYPALAGADIVNQLALALFAVSAATAGYRTASALILALIVGKALATMLLATRSRASLNQEMSSPPGLTEITQGLRRFRRFPLYGSGSALLSMASWQLPVLLLGALFSPAVAGLYLLGFRVLQVPMKLAGNAMNRVFLQEGSQAQHSDSLAPLVTPLLQQIVKATLLPVAILAVIAPDLYALVFGEQWREAGRYTQILCPWAFLWFVTGPFTGLFSILEQQRLQLFWNMLNFVSRLSAILVGAYFQNILLTIVLLSFAGVVIYGYKLKLTLQLARIETRTALAPMGRYAAISTAAAAALSLLQLALNPLLFVAAGVSITVVYLVFCFRQQIKHVLQSFAQTSS